MAEIQNSQIADLLKSRVVDAPKVQPAQTGAPAAADFGAILDSQLKLSGHAKTRLESRNIQLGQAEWDRVMGGVQKAEAKGAKESLVLMDNVALVVSVKNKTVITAVDQEHLKENVFTNIDSAVIV